MSGNPQGWIDPGPESRRLRRPHTPRPVAQGREGDALNQSPVRVGARIADIVAEVTDPKFLGKQSRKRLQLSKAGRASAATQQVKIADKLCNLRDILASPPAKWSERRKHEYFDWAKAVVDSIRRGGVD